MAAPWLPVGALGALQDERDGPAQSAAHVTLHQFGAFVASVERVPDPTKVWQGGPARLERAGARDTVTLALLVEVVFHSLDGEDGWGRGGIREKRKAVGKETSG